MTTRRKRRAVRIAAAGVAALFLVAAVGPSVERAFAPKAWTEIPSEAVVRRYLDWKRSPVHSSFSDDGAGGWIQHDTPKPVPIPIPDRCLPRPGAPELPHPSAVFDRFLPRIVVDPWFFPAASNLYVLLSAGAIPDKGDFPVFETYFGMADLIHYSPPGQCIDWCVDLPEAMITDAPTHEDEEAALDEIHGPCWSPSYIVDPASPLDRTLLAYDPLVFHVPADSPVTNLTTDQLRAVFVDRVPTWHAAGVDAPGRIFAYERDECDRAQRLAADWLKGTGSLERLSFDAPRRKPPVKRPKTPFRERVRDILRGDFWNESGYEAFSSDGAMQPFVDRPGAIGFSMMVQAAPFVEDGTIRLLSVDGVAPTAENIASGLYPVGRSLELVTYGILPAFTNNVGILRDYLRSEPGRRLLESAGYLPAPPGAPLPPVRENVW